MIADSRDSWNNIFGNMYVDVEAPLFRYKLVKMVWIIIIVAVAVYLGYRNQIILKTATAVLATMMENISAYVHVQYISHNKLNRNNKLYNVITVIVQLVNMDAVTVKITRQ